MRTLALSALVALTIGVMTIGDAFLDGNDSGIRHSYSECFTGDLSVSESSSAGFSVFGDQTPIIGSSKRQATIGDFNAVRAAAETVEGIADSAPIVCGLVVMESGSYRKPVNVFGIDAESYFRLFPGLRVSAGAALRAGERGILITEARAAEISSVAGRRLAVGENLDLSNYDAGNFQFSELPIVGILSYPLRNEALDSIVLTDADTLRALLGLAREAESIDDAASGATAESLDALFVGARDVRTEPGSGLQLDEIEALLAADDAPSAPAAESSAWNYLLLRLEPNASVAWTLKTLEKRLSDRGLSAAVNDWRATAGSSALYISWLRILFRIGVGILLTAGALIIVNILVIAVFERTKEIGTMRSLGASRSFVRRLFIAETMILVLGSALIGIAAGAAVCGVVGVNGVPIGNRTLTTLFGSDRLRPVVTYLSVLRQLAIAALVGSLTCVYPVRLALGIEQARAAATE